LLKSGFNLSGVSRKPDWAMWAIAPAKAETSITRIRGGRAAMVACFITTMAPALDKSIVPAWAMNG
jgi:hypothetical protein